MKKMLFAFAIALIAFASCQKDNHTDPYVDGNEVAVSIGLELPDASIISRSASNEGGISNWPAGLELRYQIAIYEGSTYLKSLPIIYAADGSRQATEARLISGKTYKFVVWADFVANRTDDYHYATTPTLNNITIKDAVAAYTVNDESRDAYFVSQSEEINGTKNVSLTLKRPFAKVRVITEDIADVKSLLGGKSLTDEVESISLSYNAPIYNKFNAVDGSVEKSGTYQPENIAANVAELDVANSGKATLFWDYILTEDPEVVNFKFTVSDINVVCEFNTNNIPIERNKLTTVRGNLLTNKANITIDVDGNFAGENSDDITQNLTIKVPAGSAPITYKFTGNIADGVTISFIEETANTYTGTVNVIVDKPTGADFVITLPEASAYLYGTVGNVTVETKDNTFTLAQGATIKDLIINGGNLDIEGTAASLTLTAAVEVTANVGSVAVANITTFAGAKFYWRTANGTQLREALEYSAEINHGVILTGNCDYNAGPGGNLDQQSSFLIGKTDNGKADADKEYKGYVFDGKNHTISGTAYNQVLMCYTNDVIIKNVAITSNGQNMNGMTIYDAKDVTLDKVNLKNNGRAGAIVSGSTVKITNVHTSGNGWGGINIDRPGAGLDFSDGTNTFAEAAKVWADHADVNTYTVNLPSGWASTYIGGSGSNKQTIYHLIGAGPVVAGEIMLNGNSSYPSIADAIADAVSGDVIYVGEGEYAGADFTIKAGVTVQGNGAGTVIKSGVSGINLLAGATLKNLTHECDYVTGDHNYNPVDIKGNNATIDNVVFNYTGTGNRICVITDMGITNFTVKNSTFTGYWKSLYLNTSEGFQILNNTFNKTAISTDGYSLTMVIKDNTFNRDVTAGESWQVPHLIVSASLVPSNDTNDWNGDFKTKLNEILNDNTWTGGQVTALKSIRVQPVGGGWNKYVTTPF